ncbi:Conserved oligomeric complex COG6 protein, partial [Helicosporidium sp. ATCC 50920]
ATLGVVSESVARPLKVRVEQVLLSGPNPVLAFWLSQLLGFYLDTVGALLPADGALVQALQGGRSMALRLCFEQFKQRGEKLARYPPPPPTDLSPPPAAVEAAQQAVELILCLEGGVQSAETHEGDAVRAALLPIALVCERSSEALDPHALTRVDEGGHLDPAGRRVYMLNCLSTLMAPLEGHAVAEGISAELGAMVEEHIRCLVEESRGRVLALCGLAEVAARVQFFKVEGASGGERAADQAGLDLSSVAKALRSFFGRVSDADALPTFGKLLAAPIKQDVTQRLLRELAAAYTDVYDLLHAPEGGYDGGEVAAVVRHSPDQIRTLLGVA